MNEAQIRQRLIEHLARRRSGTAPTFISELCIDGFERRVDLVRVGARLEAFEIKSDHDRLTRLQGQLESYGRLFERVTVVCTARHLSAVQAQIPAGIGLWTVDPGRGFAVVRPPQLMPPQRREDWLSFLPVVELRRLLRAHGQPVLGPRELLLQRAATLPRRQIREAVLDSLRHREQRLAPLRARQAALSDGPRSAARLPSAEARLRAFLERVSPPLEPWALGAAQAQSSSA